MPAVGKFMVRPFNAHLVKRADGIANRHMEGICIVRFIGHAGNNAVLLAVDTDKASGKPFCRRCNKAEIQIIFIAHSIHFFTHMTNDIFTKLLCFLTLCMMAPQQRSQCLSQANETNAQSTMLDSLFNPVVTGQFITVQI